ncbi:histidine kinase dimerization/phosphoacceptor domain-containing protein, partial [Actinotalea sp. C106]|uniref:histidine kinase n=1 Tax=Actinotalea sp. C106 TaxID=2908644 RepID=UPI0020295CE6
MTPAFTELDTRRLGPVRRYFARRPVAMDLVVMALFAVPALLSLVLEPLLGMHQDGTDRVVATALTLAGAAALYWRRRRPLLVSGAIGALGLACVGVTGSIEGFDLGLAFMVYAVAASRPARTAWLTLLTLCLVLGAGVWLWEAPMTDLDVPTGLVATVGEPEGEQEGVAIGSDQRAGTITSMVMIGLVAIAIGSSVRNRRLHVAELVGRGNALARERDQQAQLARAAERSRIAREMHDVVAHSLSVMIALADGAGAALDRAADRSRAALD